MSEDNDDAGIVRCQKCRHYKTDHDLLGCLWREPDACGCAEPYGIEEEPELGVGDARIQEAMEE